MITDCPHLRDSQSAMMRGMTSAVPPAGKGTMIFTVRVGKSCACAGMAMAPSASTKAGSVHPKRRDNTARFFDIMLLLLEDLVGSPRNLAKADGCRQYAPPRHSGLQRCHAAAALPTR